MSVPTKVAVGGQCEGYGGIFMALQQHLDVEHAWYAEVDPAASQVLAHHYPGVVNHGDITAMDWASAERVDIFTAGFPCFVAGTMILTRGGYTPIEDVKVGDEVLTHAGRWRSVTCAMVKDDAPLWQVKSGQVITTTPEHPFYVRTQGRTWNNQRRRDERTLSDPDWVNAEDLQPGRQRVGHVLPPVDDASDRDGAWWWVVGRYLADGHRMKRYRTGAGNPVQSDQGTVVISCGKGKEEELRLNIKRAGLRATESPSRTALKFIITGQEFYRFTAAFGKGAQNKQLTGEALALPTELAEELLQGWLSGDGHRTSGGYAGVTTSKKLALGLVLLAHRARGVFATIRLTTPGPTKVIEGRTVSQRPWWRINIPFRNRSAIVEGDRAWRLIKDSRPAGGRGRVYNISVDEDESYIADGVIVHNCQPFSAAGKRGGTEDERHLWPTGVLPAIRALMPPLVVLENVPGILTIERGQVFGQVLADLDALGYAVSWTTVGACKVGACHHRHRVFIAATLSEVRQPLSDPIAHRAGSGWGPAQFVLFGDAEAVRWPQAGFTAGGTAWEMVADVCGADGQVLPTPHTSDTNGAGVHGDGGLDLRTVVSMFPTPTARDATRGAGRTFAEGRPLSEVIALLPTPVAGDADRASFSYSRGNPTLLGAFLPTPRASDAEKGGPNQWGSSGDVMLPAAVQPERFGQYAQAVHRHELAYGLPVPEPTEPGRTGRPRLAPEFPSWMQGLPRGWLTDVVARKDAVRLAGNGVNVRQAVYALGTLFERLGVSASTFASEVAA